MIVGIGHDLIEMSRIQSSIQRESFLNRVYTEKERELIAQDSKKAAGNFAVKEAVVKMFGTGFREAQPHEIETLRDELGKPYVNLFGAAKELAEKMNITTIHVSITNTKQYASAVVIGESLSN